MLQLFPYLSCILSTSKLGSDSLQREGGEAVQPPADQGPGGLRQDHGQPEPALPQEDRRLAPGQHGLRPPQPPGGP